MSSPFSLGVNYWPRRKAMYWWQNFDGCEVDEEFALIRELGLDTVRLFLMWEDFQPTPDTVCPTALDNLTTVCDLASKHNLALNITFFTGHMSGPNWPPRWMCQAELPYPGWEKRPFVCDGRLTQAGGYQNMYVAGQTLNASRLLVKTVVSALKDHPAVGVWNLGNEPDIFAAPPNAAAGQTWARDMVRLIHDLDPDARVAFGLRFESLYADNGFRVDQVYHETDVAVMHAYPMYVKLARDPLDPDLVPFTCALTTALCGKPTLMEEFGGCTAPPGHDSFVWAWQMLGEQRTQFMASEEALAEYLAQVLPKLVEVGAAGALLWCFSDYVESLWTKPPCDVYVHERFFGLVRPDGSLKPHARVIQAFAETKPEVQTPARRVELGMTPDEYYANPEKHMADLYQQFLNS